MNQEPQLQIVIHLRPEDVERIVHDLAVLVWLLPLVLCGVLFGLALIIWLGDDEPDLKKSEGVTRVLHGPFAGCVACAVRPSERCTYGTGTCCKPKPVRGGGS